MSRVKTNIRLLPTIRYVYKITITGISRTITTRHAINIEMCFVYLNPVKVQNKIETLMKIGVGCVGPCWGPLWGLGNVGTHNMKE